MQHSPSRPVPLAGAHRRPPDLGARWRRIGVAAAVALFVALGLLWTLAVPLFNPADEGAHTDYAFQVGEGRIPESGLRSREVPEFPGLGQRAGVQHVTNHPPLYYLLVSPLVHWGYQGAEVPWLLTTRMVGVLMSGLTVMLVGILAQQVFARQLAVFRGQLAVAAAGLVAALPALVGASASIQNDALVVMLGVLALVSAMSIFRRGSTPGRLLTVSLLCGLGMLSRITFGQVLVAVCVIVTYGIVSNSPGRAQQQPATGRAVSGPSTAQRQRWMAALGQLITLGLITALTAGWFYVMSLRRYGDLTGGSAIYALVESRPLPEGNIVTFLLAPSSWWHQILQLAGSIPGSIENPLLTVRVLAIILVSLMAVALVGAIVRSRQRDWHLLDRQTWALLGIQFLVLAISTVQLADHVMNRGAENNRYLLSAVGFLGLGISLLVIVGSPRRWAVLPTAVIACGAAGSVQFIAAMVRRQRDLAGENWFIAIGRSMGKVGVPAPFAITIVLILIVTGCVVLNGIAINVLRRIPTDYRHLGPRPWPPGQAAP